MISVGDSEGPVGRQHTRYVLNRFSSFLLLIITMAGAGPALGQSGPITYQGNLRDGAGPANGLYDLRFTFYDVATGGNALGMTVTNASTAVSNGLFTVRLDCGTNVFTGSDRWLEIAVRTNGNTGAYEVLSPRQLLTSTPYALYAANAAGFAGQVSDAQLSSNIVRFDAIDQVFPGAAQFTNGGSKFVGTFSGDGASLSNIDATVRVFPGNIVVGPKGRVDTTGTTTAGIQEAIYSLPQAPDGNSPGGGTVILAPGTYLTTDTILADCAPSKTNPITIKLIGPGMTAGGITCVGPTPKSVIKVGRPYGCNRVGFQMEDMWVSSALNATTNIIYLAGFSDGSANYATGPFGGIYSAIIRNCWIAWADAMTNNAPFGFAPGEHFNDNPGKHNLIGVDVLCNYNGMTVIENCFFDGCLGIAWATDHGTIRGNQFQNCGIGAYSQANDWPSSSPFYMGAAITCRQPPYLWNGNQVWNFENNTFINCFLPYFAGDGPQEHPIFSSGDQIEPGPARDFVATTGKRWIALNPHIYAGDLRPYTNNWIVTNTSDFSSWRAFRDLTNCVRVDLPAGGAMLSGSFLKTDGVLTYWSLDGSAFTNINAANLTSGVIPPARMSATNLSPFTETARPNIPLNSWQTNSNQRNQFTFRVSFQSGATDPVHAELLVDNDRDGTWDKRLTIGVPANTPGRWTNSLSTVISPNARFTVTNYSGAGASFNLIDVLREGL